MQTNSTATTHAAVVSEFGRAPRYVATAVPIAGEGSEVVTLVAAALHPRVRSQATGAHYTSTGELPLVPGIDGVGRRPDGSLVYFVLPDTTLGSMAERVAIDPRRSIPVPSGADPLLVAAAMNPAMSSWIALRRRARMREGQSVLVLGATGSAGQLAVQVALRLGASRVVAAGRDEAALAALGDAGAEVVSIAGEPSEFVDRVAAMASEVDIVVDYLYGPVAEATIPALLRARRDRGRSLVWVQVGAVAGPTISIASEMLRAANFTLMGSGQGSVPTAEILDELGVLVEEVAAGRFSLEVDVRRLEDVERVWIEPRDARRRIVFTG